MTSCPNCGLQFSDPSLKPSFCPNCGERFDGEFGATPSGPALIGAFWGRLWQILTRPTEFFRQMPVRGGLAGPLAFALVVHWIGASVTFIWNSLLGGAIGSYVNQIIQMAGDVAEVDHPGRTAQLFEMSERIQHWVWGAGSVIADPFLTLARILFISFWIYLGARILVTPGKNQAPREITFESAVRVICYGLTPSILAALPLLGGVISGFYILAVTVIGAKEVYRVSSGRAMLIALFPQFLVLFLIGLIFLVFGLALLKMFASVF
ncbi:YIP1 family protein [Bdellovibrionota bacterium FG-1]